jgi:ketosteroid isomerase-like protein
MPDKNLSTSTPTAEQVVLGFFKALDNITTDAASFVNLFAEDMRFWAGGTTKFSGEVLGRDNFMTMLGALGEPIDGFIKLDLQRVINGGDWIMTEAQGSAMLKTGQPYNNRYVHIWRVSNGKVVELIEYFDTALVDKVFGPQA